MLQSGLAKSVSASIICENSVSNPAWHSSPLFSASYSTLSFTVPLKISFEPTLLTVPGTISAECQSSSPIGSSPG